MSSRRTSSRARKASDNLIEESKTSARQQSDDILESARRDIEQETKRSLDAIRREVANLTVVATEKVTRRSLDDDDHRRLVEEALDEVDFSTLAKQSGGSSGNGGSGA